MKKRKKYRKWSVFRSEPYWKRYRTHKLNAEYRGISFKLTYPEWVKIWLDSGKIDKSGIKGHQYCMARDKDQGGYELGNVSIVTSIENCSNNYGRKTQSIRERKKRSNTIKQWWNNKTATERAAHAAAIAKSWKDRDH